MLKTRIAEQYGLKVPFINRKATLFSWPQLPSDSKRAPAGF